MKHSIPFPRLFTITAWAMISTALPACAHEASPSNLETPSSKTAPAPRSKSGSLISITAPVSRQTVSIGPMNVRLKLQFAPSVKEVSLTYQAEGQLRIDASAPSRARPDDMGQATVEVPVTIMSKGLHYLHVLAQANGRSTAYSVRLDTGESRTLQKSSAPLPGGEFIEMPAQESRGQ
jgi:hypothetical protein